MNLKLIDNQSQVHTTLYLAMDDYQRALALLADAFLAQVAFRNTVSVGCQPQSDLFAEFVIIAFEEDIPDWESNLKDVLAKCHSSPEQQQRILQRAWQLYSLLAD